MEEVDFVEIVPGTEQEEADMQFEAWLSDHGLERSDIDPDDVRVDLIRSEDNRTLKRYRIRHSYLGEATP